MPEIRRYYLDWTRPALPAAADWLLAQAPAAGDLAGTTVVVPGSRAGRRLLEILVDKAQRRGQGLSPPQIVTMGALPELLYPPQRPFADERTQQLAWMEALRRIREHEVQRAEIEQFLPAFPAPGETESLLELANAFCAEHVELAAEGLDFDDVARQMESAGQMTESRRWRAFRHVQRTYLDVLDQLHLWDIQTARLVAIEQKECATARQIVLLGTVDMNRATRWMLDQVSSQVTALIFAPESRADYFDAYGCVEPVPWATAEIKIDDSRVTLADDPIDQADEAVRAIALWGDSSDRPCPYRGDEITIGVCDERVVPQIIRQFEECGLTARWGPGWPVTETAPFRLLQAVADYLDSGHWRDFAALVRHADVECWLDAQPDIEKLADNDWLTSLDDYHGQHVPSRLGDPWLAGPEDINAVQVVYQGVSRWLAELNLAGTGPALAESAGTSPRPPVVREGTSMRPLTEWSQPLVRLLLTIYGQRSFRLDISTDRQTLAGLEKIHEALWMQQRARAIHIPSTTAAEAIRWALNSIAGETVSPPVDAHAIELLGWLELTLDDAPALVITTLNEGFVPKSSTGDLFLPDSLRAQLGLDDNARRYAREVYALSAMLASRDVRIVVGRRDADGYPLAPSRLLFACDDAALVRRAHQFFSPPPALIRKQPLAGALCATSNRSAFVVPRPKPLAEPIQSLSVTQFRDYLACPYRFYLRHVLRLKALDDATDELDGGMFGELAHDVLKQFGRGDQRNASRFEVIVSQFDELLHELARARFGSNPLPAVAVQIEQLRRRLEALARIQADRAAAGWRIRHVEVPQAGKSCPFKVGKGKFRLYGRIDRIDFHEGDGRFAIWDYKTSDALRSPDSAHRTKDKKWTDLQLPLYRHLAAVVDSDLKKRLKEDGHIQLGYIQLPKHVEEVRFDIAPWLPADLASADKCARTVIRKLRKSVFWPYADPPPDFSEDLAGICLDGVFGRAVPEKVSK